MAVGTDGTKEADNQTTLLKERPTRKEILPADVSYSQFDETTGGALRVGA